MDTFVARSDLSCAVVVAIRQVSVDNKVELCLAVLSHGRLYLSPRFLPVIPQPLLTSVRHVHSAVIQRDPFGWAQPHGRSAMSVSKTNDYVFHLTTSLAGTQSFFLLGHPPQSIFFTVRLQVEQMLQSD